MFIIIFSVLILLIIFYLFVFYHYKLDSSRDQQEKNRIKQIKVHRERAQKLAKPIFKRSQNQTLS